MSAAGGYRGGSRPGPVGAVLTLSAGLAAAAAWNAGSAGAQTARRWGGGGRRRPGRGGLPAD